MNQTFKRTITEHRVKVSQFSSTIISAPNVLYLEYFLQIAPQVKLPLRIFRPSQLSAPYPTVLYIPGTAFVAQETQITHAICSNIAALAQCQIIVVNHRLAPEYKFPLGLNDTKTIISYIVTQNPPALNLDPNKIALAGYSSGGNLAAQISLSKALPLRCQVLVSPLVDLSRSINSHMQFEQEDHVIPENFVRWFLDLYIPQTIRRDHPRLSPYYKKIPAHKSIPTYILFGEKDRFRGDAEGYIRKLNQANIFVKHKMFYSSTHAFFWYQYESFEIIAKIIQLNFAASLEKSLLTLTVLKMENALVPKYLTSSWYGRQFVVYNSFFMLCFTTFYNQQNNLFTTHAKVFYTNTTQCQTDIIIQQHIAHGMSTQKVMIRDNNFTDQQIVLNLINTVKSSNNLPSALTPSLSPTKHVTRV